MTTEWSDAHHEPHSVVEVVQLAARGMALASEVSVSRRHAQIVLFSGEGAPRELLGCWEGEEALEDLAFGVPFEDVLDLIAHACWHVRTGNGPNPDCPFDDWRGPA